MEYPTERFPLYNVQYRVIEVAFLPTLFHKGYVMSNSIDILGLHHITIVCANAQRTLNFYTQVLGQRFVKKTVNFDAPDTYHLYFGDEVGHPGTAITFFEWPDSPQGRPGIGGTHHFAMQVPDYTGLLKWKRRLVDMGLTVDGRSEERR